MPGPVGVERVSNGERRAVCKCLGINEEGVLFVECLIGTDAAGNGRTSGGVFGGIAGCRYANRGVVGVHCRLHLENVDRFVGKCKAGSCFDEGKLYARGLIGVLKFLVIAGGAELFDVGDGGKRDVGIETTAEKGVNKALGYGFVRCAGADIAGSACLRIGEQREG